MASLRFPALSESAPLRYLAFSALYVAQGIPHPLNHLTLLATAGFIINLFTVFQDIAVDGLAIDIVPENQQARANGLMWGSKTLGKSAAVVAGAMIDFFGKIRMVTIFLILLCFDHAGHRQVHPFRQSLGPREPVGNNSIRERKNN